MTYIDVTIATDDYGYETTWELVNNCNSEVVAQGGPYTANEQKTFAINFVACDDTEYTFTIFDLWGDGICCGYGEGRYEVKKDGNIVVSGGEFENLESVTFGHCLEHPSSAPTSAPSSQPSSAPSSSPSTLPSSGPTSAPSSRPSSQPSSAPTSSPSIFPSSEPTSTPSSSPSSQPSATPTSRPTSIPSTNPSILCEDSSEILHPSGLTCSWIKQDPLNRCSLQFQGKRAWEECAYTCKTCGCKDVSFKTSRNKDCAWVQILPEVRCFLYDGRLNAWAYELCRATCTAC